MASAQQTCFTNLNFEEVEEKEDEFKNINSLKNEKKAVDAFKLYLEHLGLKDTDFFKFTKLELDKHLATFWWNAVWIHWGMNWRGH